MKKVILPLALFCSASVGAFSVDSMFKIDNGKDNFLLLKNTTNRVEFINVRLSKITVEQGKVQEQPFDTEDFLHWPVYTTPSSIILDPGSAERVSIVRVNKENKEDAMVGISLIPDTLSSFNNSVDVSVGYKAWYLMPGSSEMTGRLTASRDSQGNIVLRNQTNKHLSMTINACGDKSFTDKECISSLFMLSGTSKEVALSTLKGSTGNRIHIRYHDALKKAIHELAI
ncbi:hypothetical protein [Aeromonas veronii]|uniref:hypothetical protein n=1 Tax=Aeromonas veronii TaxID=654 RepID=UPI003B9ECDC2